MLRPLALVIDSFLGFLQIDEHAAENFISALCEIPKLKTKLVDHLLPSLRDQVKEMIDPMMATIKNLQDDLKEAHLKNDDIEMYTRRNAIRVSGIPEGDAEETDNKIIQFAFHKLNILLPPSEICRSHRIGSKNSGKPRDIIVKFTTHNRKISLLRETKKLITVNSKIHPNARIYMREDLTHTRAVIYATARDLKKNKFINTTYTRDGMIYIKDRFNNVHDPPK